VNGIVCARARSIASCANGRASQAQGARDAYRLALASVESVEHAGSCDARAQSLVQLTHDLAGLASAAKDAAIEGNCTAGASGLTCDSFPLLSKRTKAAITDAQDALYHQCYCPPLAQDRAPLTGARLVREALSCTAAPEEFALAPAPDAPLKDADVSEWQAHRMQTVPTYTAQQCPSCVRLARRMDDELSRAVTLGHSQAQVMNLLKRALAPVTELHDRAFLLMTGDFGVRCSARPDEWAIIAQAQDFSVEPRDMFKDGGQLDPARLEAKLKQAALLRASLDGLSCTRVLPSTDLGQIPAVPAATSVGQHVPAVPTPAATGAHAP
jgi:hypothetical protein